MFLNTVLSATFLLLLHGGYCATQVDVRLGSSDFFLGEKFMITVSDVIYWLTGMCMGVLFAITFIVVSDFQAFQKRMDGLGLELEEEDMRSNRIGGSSRGARLIGPRKYPTSLEQRMLSAIETEPSNYFAGDGKDPSMTEYRRGKLIGSMRLPTGMEEHVLKDLSVGQDNTFDNFSDGNSRQPRLIGPKKYPTQMEDHFLRPVSTDVSNTFVEN